MICTFDIITPSIKLIAGLSVLMSAMISICLHDRHSALLISHRARRCGSLYSAKRLFEMLILSNQIGESTANGSSPRITFKDRFIRRRRLMSSYSYGTHVSAICAGSDHGQELWLTQNSYEILIGPGHKLGTPL